MMRCALSLLFAPLLVCGLARNLSDTAVCAANATTLTLVDQQSSCTQINVHQARENDNRLRQARTQHANRRLGASDSSLTSSTALVPTSDDPGDQRAPSVTSSSSSIPHSSSTQSSSSLTSIRNIPGSQATTFQTVPSTPPPAPTPPYPFPWEAFTLAPPPPNWPYTRPGVARRPGITTTWPFQTRENQTVALFEASLVWSPRPVGKQTRISIAWPVNPSPPVTTFSSSRTSSSTAMSTSTSTATSADKTDSSRGTTSTTSRRTDFPTITWTGPPASTQQILSGGPVRLP